MTNHKPTCPYCGAEMIPQRESTDMTRGIDFMQCSKCAARSPEIRTLNGAWDGKQDAALAAAMQRYVEPNRILSADDLTQMEGDPVFIQQGDGDEFWAMIEDGKPIIGECDPYFQNLTMPPPLHDPAGHFGLHVLGWRAMKRRPTDEERANARWED